MVNTEPYKGVRDFYPEDLFLQKYLFQKMRETVESFGYEEYGASILEPAELYRAKSGEEIVNEQTYTFLDRGEREVTLRPEMTPTLARMVAKRKRDLAFPLRWYSIPNLFRYENTQRGRLREHFQLNVDIFGGEPREADLEILILAHSLLKNLGAKDEDFKIIINNRKVAEMTFEKLGLNSEQKYKISKVIDKRDKISENEFKTAAETLLQEKAERFIEIMDSNKKMIDLLGEQSPEIKELTALIDGLYKFGIKNIEFNQNLMRGFDYYTGTIFEIFDTNPKNSRSLFGGGRFDELLQIFGEASIPAVGFGAGDVTLLDFLETHNLLPDYRSQTQIYICRLDQKFTDEANRLAQDLRKQGINSAVDLTTKKTGDQIKTAAKKKIPFIVCLGENEIKSNRFKVKNLESGEETDLSVGEIADFVKKNLS